MITTDPPSTVPDPLLTGDQPESEDYGWRVRVFDALQAVGNAEQDAQDYLECGNIWLGVQMCEDDISHSKPVPATCHKRYCPDCAKRDSARLVHAYVPQIKQIVSECPRDKNYKLRHIVLTSNIDLNDDQAAEKIKNFKICVAKTFDHFCGGKLSKSNQHRWSESASQYATGEGYVYSLEFGEHGTKLHAHIIFFGRYIQKNDLSEIWESITTPLIGPQIITWIEKIDNVEGAIFESLKYLTKFTSSFTDARSGEIVKYYPDPQFIARLAILLKGKRRVITRGCFRGLETDLQEPGSDDVDHPCKQCSHATTRISLTCWLANYRDLYARRLLDLKSGNKIEQQPAAENPDPPPRQRKINSRLTFGQLTIDQQAYENYEKSQKR